VEFDFLGVCSFVLFFVVFYCCIMQSIDIVYDFLLDCGFIVKMVKYGRGPFIKPMSNIVGGSRWVRCSNVKIYSDIDGDPWGVVFCYSEDGRVVLGASLLDDDNWANVLQPLKRDFFDYFDNPSAFEHLKRYLLFWDWSFIPS
tara:strand:- start:109 stop:537 length:429 start_codon:yes stop_codon:yes gene_type:complete